MGKRKTEALTTVCKGVQYLVSLYRGVLSLQQCSLGFKEDYILLTVDTDGSVGVSYPDARQDKRFFPKPGIFGKNVTTVKIDFGITIATIKLLIT